MMVPTETIPLFSKRPDGSTVISMSFTEWGKIFGAAADEEKVVLEDGRPAVRREPMMRDLPATYVTLHHAAWDELTRAERRYHREFLSQPQPSRSRLCSACGAELKVKREWHRMWGFYCPRCQSPELLGKDLYGGTIGQGEGGDFGT